MREQEKKDSIIWIIWFVFLMTHFVYMALTYFQVLPYQAHTESNCNMRIFYIVFISLAFFTFLGAEFIYQKLLNLIQSRRHDYKEKNKKIFIWSIIIWALYESVSLNAFVLGLLVYPASQNLIFLLMFIGLGFHLLRNPRRVLS